MNILHITVLVSLASICAALADLGWDEFDCSTWSGYAKNVNELRPGNIKVVAAFGDTPVPATGAGATKNEQLKLEYRGLSFLIGGDKCLEEHISIPNILKKFNRKVFGQSYGIGPVNDLPHAQLNVAVANAKAVDLLSQAKELVQRMYQMRSVIDIKKDWKLISLYIGNNDACYYCKYGPVEGLKSSPCSYKAYIEQALKYLYDNVPRAIVSIVSMRTILPPFTAGELEKLAPACKAFYMERTECPCRTGKSLADATKLTRAYQKAVLEIQNEGKYDKEDFTVVVQPAFENVAQAPLLENGALNTVFYTADCANPSQYGHAMLAKKIWNNLMQPIGSKVSNYSMSDPNIPLLCPKWSCPYIRTKKNSVKCTPPVYKDHEYHSGSHEYCGKASSEEHDKK